MALHSKLSDYTEKIGSSNLEPLDQNLDLESGTAVHELNKPAPGMWRFPTNTDLCCIYRVPNCLRQENPVAYTPELVLIGPLHRSLKSQALKDRGDITKIKSMGYLNMEAHKKIYLVEFAKRFGGNHIIDEFRRTIKEDEDLIRASYSESTAWIESPEFVEMILHDSVFILEFILRDYVEEAEKIGDPLMDEHCLLNTIKKDLILLENQLPYFIIKKLFNSVIPRFNPDLTLRKLVVSSFLETNIRDNSNFIHFTDLIRCVRVETVPDHGFGKHKHINHMYNADKLYNGGVKFRAIKDEMSVEVKFKKGVLEIPRFLADDDAEIHLRNIMALEQCHYPLNAHVCNYVIFLDYLIDTEKDVDLLVEKGVIKNWTGHNGAVAKMVNKLCLGVIDDGSYYSRIASRVKRYHRNQLHKSRGILRRVYCTNLWKGIATVAATCLLLMTLIQTVTAIIEVLPK